MGAIGLNPIRLDRIGLDPIRINAIKLGVPGAASGTDRPYIDPEVLASLKAVCICYGKSNDDPDRAIVKNLVDPDNPFVISNAAFKLNSGFGKYEVDFTVYNNQNVLVSPNKIVSIAGREFISLLPYTELSKTISSYKIKVTGLIGEFSYWYRNQDGSESRIIITKDGIYQLPTCYNVENGQGSSVGFNGYSESSCTIEQIPSFEGAFVTDGIDDTIISTKTLAEMGITDEVTVVSMIHQISLNPTYNNGFTNYIENLDKSTYVRNNIYKAGKTGIYGYSASLTSRTYSDINNILGDKKDYGTEIVNRQNTLDRTKFSVVGRASNISEVSSIAWYWNFISNKYLTTDQINQVIAYFNLDRTLKPDILCNVKKQGITNENHAEFGDKLIDYSGNGRDIQLNNIAWKGDSGIGKYVEDFTTWYGATGVLQTFSKIEVTDGFKHNWVINRRSGESAINSFKVLIKGIPENGYIQYRYFESEDATKKSSIDIYEDGEYSLPNSTLNNLNDLVGFQLFAKIPPLDSQSFIGLTITQIPSHAGALCLDGVNDFGQFVGDLGLKDYTFIADRAYDRIVLEQAPFIASKSTNGQAPFLMEYLNSSNYVYPHSFGATTKTTNLNIQRQISYQSTYVYNGNSISKGTSVDTGDGLTIGNSGSTGEQYSPLCLWSLMLFPYSMSEFLIERQLKKHKLGTLYPDMVEFRPVIKANNDYEIVYTAIIKPNNWQEISIGDYVTVGKSVAIQIKLNNPLEVTNVSSNSLADVSFYKEETGDNVYTIYGRLLDGKSPQKISLTIEQDENYVLFKPTINSNAIFEVGNEETMPELFTQLNNGEIDGIILYMQGDKAVLPNNWIDKNTKVRAIIYCLDTVSEEDIHFTVDGKTKYCYSAIEDGLAAFGIMDEDSQEEQYMTNVLTANTIDIQIDQYIRYEDIVQPYPVLLRFNDENGNEVSWGGKFRVGSTITRIGSFYENNLLDGLYTVRNPKLNGNNLITPTHVVEKSMVFTCDTEYLLDNNEPKVILSPRLLRIPNSSYKILGYIPDISGNGNHGKINNSAYAEGSGVNEDGSYQFDGVDDFVTIPTLSSGGKQVLMKVNWNTLNEIIYDQRGNSNDGYTFAIFASDEDNAIAYSGRNKGETYIDGILNNNILASQLKQITHNITISNKDVNSNNSTIPYIGRSVSSASYSKMALYDFMLFDDISTDDKIKELNEYVGIEAKVELPPYYWDNYGKTNLDEDKNYTANLGTVKDVIEVSKPAIFAENWYDYYESLVSRSPIINQTDYSIEVKPTHMDSNFMMMLSVDCDTPLPAFRAKFTRTSNVDVSNAEIRYVYYVNGKSTYIDIFGENNSAESVILDIPASEKSSISGSNADNFPNILIEVLPADNSTRYGLSNTNFAYDKMSGFGGYPFSKFTDIGNKWQYIEQNSGIEFVSLSAYSYTAKRIGDNTWYYSNIETKYITKDILINVRCSKSIEIKWELKYKTNDNPDSYSTKALLTGIIGQDAKVVTLRHVTDEELETLGAIKDSIYYLFYFDPIALPIGEEYTIEMLPLYPNGLVYDGVTDYSENANIPALTDYTYVFKRDILGFNSRSTSMHKGTSTNHGRAFTSDYDYGETNEVLAYSFGSSIATPNATSKKIIYGTKASVDGQPITPGTNVDDVGLFIGKWYDEFFKKMVFYKLILYPKTIPLLQINFLKNLMEKDEIIDLNNKIFIQE